MQGSRGRRIQRPGTKKNWARTHRFAKRRFPGASFFRHEASRNFRYFTLVSMFISHRVLVTSQDNCFQSLVYIFAPPRVNYVTGRLSYISDDRGNEACSQFDKQINLTSHLTMEGQSELPHPVKRCSECIEGGNVSRDVSICKDIFPQSKSACLSKSNK